MTDIIARKGKDGVLRVALFAGMSAPTDIRDDQLHSREEFEAMADEMLELQARDRRGFTTSMAARIYAKHNRIGPGTPVLQNVEPDEADFGFGATELPDPQAFYADYNQR